MKSPAPGTLAETLRANARYHGDTVAVQCNGRSLTHAELYRRACRLASAWAAAGLRPTDRVSVLAMNEIEYFELYAAAELSGIVLATLNFRLAVPELAFILKDSAPRHLVFEAQYLPAVEQLRAQLPGIEQYACIGGEAPGPGTTGTTGMRAKRCSRQRPRRSTTWPTWSTPVVPPGGRKAACWASAQ